MKNLIVAALIVMMGFMVFICSCSVFPRRTAPEFIPKTQKELLYRSVMQTHLLLTAAIIGIGLSMFSFINGGKHAMAAAVACFIVLTMSLAVARFATVMAIVGTLVSFGLSVYTVFVKNRAIKEVVKNVQDYKNAHPKGIELSGFKNYLSDQSETTKAIVNSITK